MLVLLSSNQKSVGTADIDLFWDETNDSSLCRLIKCSITRCGELRADEVSQYAPGSEMSYLALGAATKFIPNRCFTTRSDFRSREQSFSTLRLFYRRSRDNGASAVAVLVYDIAVT